MKTINLTHSHKDLQFNILAAVVEGLSASGIAGKGRFITYRSLDDSEFSIELWKSATKSENGDGKLIHRHTINKGDYQMNDIRLGVTMRYIADHCKKFISEIKEYQEEGLTLEYPVFNFRPMSEIPELNPKQTDTSFDVLIDLDGWRKDFYIGCYHTDFKEWRLKKEDTDDFEIDFKHGRWTYLPHAARDKKVEL